MYRIYVYDCLCDTWFDIYNYNISSIFSSMSIYDIWYGSKWLNSSHPYMFLCQIPNWCLNSEPAGKARKAHTGMIQSFYKSNLSILLCKSLENHYSKFWLALIPYCKKLRPQRRTQPSCKSLWSKDKVVCPRLRVFFWKVIWHNHMGQEYKTETTSLDLSNIPVEHTPNP